MAILIVKDKIKGFVTKDYIEMKDMLCVVIDIKTGYAVYCNRSDEAEFVAEIFLQYTKGQHDAMIKKTKYSITEAKRKEYPDG